MQNPPADALLAETPPHLVASVLVLPQCEQASLLLAAESSPGAMPRTVGEITKLVRRVRAGEELSPEEREKLRAHYARYTRRKKGVHLKGNREREWVELAQRQGLSLSSWIQERVEEALHPSDRVAAQLREENEALRAEITALRGTTGQLSVENAELRRRMASLEASLLKAMDHAMALAEVT